MNYKTPAILAYAAGIIAGKSQGEQPLINLSKVLYEISQALGEYEVICEKIDILCVKDMKLYEILSAKE